MASETSSAGLPHQITLDGVKHELIIRTRQGKPVMPPYVKQELIQRTVGAWMKAYQAFANDLEEVINDYPLVGWDDFIEDAGLSDTLLYLFHDNGFDELCLQPSEGDPYVTVFNKTYSGMSITVTSRDNGQAGYDEAIALKAAIEIMQDKAPQVMGKTSPTPPARPTLPTQRELVPQDTQAQAPQHLSVWGRSTQAGMAEGLIALESGELDNPHFKTQARIMLEPYSFDIEVEQEEYRVYGFNGQVSIRNTKTGKRALVLGCSTGGSIWVFEREDRPYQGGFIKSDWHKALAAMDMWAEPQRKALAWVQVGYSTQVDVRTMSLIAMKFKPSEDRIKTWANFVGFYSGSDDDLIVPEGDNKIVDFDDIPF